MQLDHVLTQLERAQLIRPAGETEYIFKHTLTQETVYEALLKTSRREIHRRVAQTIEDLFADRLDEFAAALAQHYAEAGDDTKTLAYSLRAGDVAARVYANLEAIMHYDRALELVERNADALSVAARQELFLKRGRAFELCGHYDAALANYIEMLVYADKHHQPAMELAALLARATLHATPTPLQNLGLGRNLLAQALARARALKDRAAESKTLWNLMLAEYFAGHQAQAVAYGEQALAIARELDLREQMAFVLNDIARNYAAIGRLPEAEAALTEARQLWQEIGNLPMLADNLASAADHAASFGNYAHALALAEEAYRISQSIGNVWNQAYSRWVMGDVYLEQGEFDQAIIALNETMDLGEQAGFVVAAWVSRLLLALFYGRIGMPSRGIALLEPKTQWVRTVDVPFKALGFGVLGYLYLLMGDPARAEQFIAEAKAEANLDDLVNFARILLALTEGELALSRQDYARVVELMYSLLDKYRTTKLRLFKCDVMLLAAQGLRAQGHLDAAYAMLSQARDEAQTVGNRRTLWRILADLAEIEDIRGNREQAQALRAQVREIVEYLAARTPAELRPAFLSLPKVRQCLSN